MLPPELAKQLHLLEIRTNKIVDGITGGAYRSVFKGRGIEFDEVREYREGDDVRTIDWNVSARMNAPFVKKFIEERELTVLLLVDVSLSGAYGSSGKSKRRTAAELAALLGFSAGHAGDKVGLMIFSDKVELFVPPRSGRKHTMRIVRDVLAYQGKSPGTDISAALREASMVMKKRGIIFLLSDLIDTRDFSRELKLLNRRHDVVAVGVYDPVERRWPDGMPLVAEDAESGEMVEFSGPDALSRLNLAMDSAAAGRREACRKARVDLVEIASGSDVLKPLIDFFARRRRRQSAG